MIRIRTRGNDSKRVRELFLREFARTILLGMGETPDDGTDVLERATDCLKDELPSKTTADGISFGTEIEQVDMQSLAEATAKYVFGRRCFRNEFGSPEARRVHAKGVPRLVGMSFERNGKVRDEERTGRENCVKR